MEKRAVRAARVRRGRRTGAETKRKSVGCISPGCPERTTEVSSAGPEADKAHPATLDGRRHLGSANNLSRLTSLWFVLILQLLSAEKERCGKQVENIQNISLHILKMNHFQFPVGKKASVSSAIQYYIQYNTIIMG